MSAQRTESDDQEPKRFSWPMRFFLVPYLFYMVFSCLATSVIDARDWADDYGVARAPLGLPTSAELASIDAGQHPDGWTDSTDGLNESIQKRNHGRDSTKGLNEGTHRKDSMKGFDERIQ